MLLISDWSEMLKPGHMIYLTLFAFLWMPFTKVDALGSRQGPLNGACCAYRCTKWAWSPVTLTQLGILQANEINYKGISHYLLKPANILPKKKKPKPPMPLPPQECGITLLHLWQREDLICLPNSLHNDRCWSMSAGHVWDRRPLKHEDMGEFLKPHISSCQPESLDRALRHKWLQKMPHYIYLLVRIEWF